MAEKVSLKIFIVIPFLCGILSACMPPVDIQTFMEDDKVVTKESVLITDDSPRHLIAGNKKITGLKGDKYYRIVSENDENAKPVPNTEYPTPNKYPRYVLETGQAEAELDVIKRVPGGTIVNLRNDHTYKVEEAKAFTGATPTITVGNATLSKTDNVITVTPNAAGVTTITLGGFSTTAYGDYEVMGVAVSGIANNIVSKFTGGAKTIGTGDGKVPGFDLEVPTGATETKVDYVFAKGSGDKFEYLTVIVKPFGPPSGGDTTINLLTIGVITAPIAGEAPLTPAISTAQYTGTVTWTAGGSPFTGAKFGADTEYKAIITITPQPTYTFSTLGTDAFTVTGASSATFNSTTGVITATFPKTDKTITITTISGITAPKAGATPSAPTINNGQYSGTVKWRTGGSTFTGDEFAANTEYTMIITLTAKAGSGGDQGYTLYGLTASSFTVTTVTGVSPTSTIFNPATGEITATFPATGSKPQGPVTVNITFTTPSNKFTGGTASIPVTGAGSASFSFTVSDGSVTSIEWYQDGRKLANTGYTLVLNSITNINIIGIHEFMAIAKVDGVPYSATFVLTVTEE